MTEMKDNGKENSTLCENTRRKTNMEKKERMNLMVFSRGFGMPCKVLLASSLLLWLVLSQLEAWPTSSGRGEAEAPIVMTTELTQEEESQKDIYGIASEEISTEQSQSLEKASEGKRLNADEATELYLSLVSAKGKIDALHEASLAKDEEIDSLKKKLTKAEKEAGSKAYIMIDGLVGFSDRLPEYGVGLSIGSRLGNSLMVEVGADYMIGSSISDIADFSIDDFQFRAGIGWLF